MALRILGVDPGSRMLGYGVVERDGSRLRHIDNGVLVLGARKPMPERLCAIHAQLAEVIRTHRPDVAAFEQVFFARNARSALQLGHARGVAVLTAAEAGLPVAEYAPAEIKLAVAATGRADKAQVQQMVKLLLGLPEVPQEDAADALAVAICHSHHRLDLKKGKRR